MAENVKVILVEFVHESVAIINGNDGTDLLAVVIRKVLNAHDDSFGRIHVDVSLAVVMATAAHTVADLNVPHPRRAQELHLRTLRQINSLAMRVAPASS